MNGPDRTEHNYYNLLEVSPDAPQNEIHAAFQRAKETYRSDSPALYSMFTPEEAKELMKLIEEAFSVLGNQARRAQYDEKLRTGNAFNFAEQSLLNDPAILNDATSHDQTPDFSMAIPEAEATGAVVEPMTDLATDPMINAAGTGLSQEAFPGDPFAEFRDPIDNHQREINVEHRPDSTTPPPQGLPNESAKGPIDVQKVSTHEMGRTLISTFPIDPTIEEEISLQATFDGTFLKKVREYKQVSIAKISDHTRVGRQYIIAIEENDYLSLPAPVFVRGFIMHIARALGLDQKVTAASYMKLYKDTVKK